MAAGADKVLFGCLDEEATIELACAALQNLCHDARSPAITDERAHRNQS